MRVAPEVVLSACQHEELSKLLLSTLTSVRLARVRGCHTNKEITAQLGIGRPQVARWRERYLESGLSGTERDLPRGAPTRKIDVERLIELTTQGRHASKLPPVAL